MSRQGVRRVIGIYFAIAVLYGAFHFLATSGSGDLEWPAMLRNILGWTVGPLVLGDCLPALFWSFSNFRAERAASAATWIRAARSPHQSSGIWRRGRLVSHKVLRTPTPLTAPGRCHCTTVHSINRHETSIHDGLAIRWSPRSAPFRMNRI